MQDIAKDLRIRELEDTIHELERNRDSHARKHEVENVSHCTSILLLYIN